MSISDEEIILSLQKEFDPKLFGILMEHNRDSIRNQCRNYVKNSEVAEDLCQEVMIKVYLKISTFKSDSRFGTWLYSIVHNHCMDYLKKNRKELHQEITDELKDEVADLIHQEEEFRQEITEDLLYRLLDQITPEGKLILLLKYKERKSIREIQVALNITESTVKMRLKRARDKINRIYQNS